MRDCRDVYREDILWRGWIYFFVVFIGVCFFLKSSLLTLLFILLESTWCFII